LDNLSLQDKLNLFQVSLNTEEFELVKSSLSGGLTQTLDSSQVSIKRIINFIVIHIFNILASRSSTSASAATAQTSTSTSTSKTRKSKY
jgi:hypothetical protein